MNTTERKNLIGKHLMSKQAKATDWDGIWPEINDDGIITDILDGDCIPDDAILVDWSSNTKRGHAVVVDGSNGFEAVLA